MNGAPRILGVDDSLTIRKALELVLKPAGYDLELAGDGAEAIDKAKSSKPALILLDFILPDMRGTEVCRRLAADPDTANIPVVLISAKGAEIRQAYRDVGNVVSYIAKPFKPQVVTTIVAEVLAKSAAGELVKSRVRVHEGEGIAAMPPRLPSAPVELEPLPPTPRAMADVLQLEPTPPGNGDAQPYEERLAAVPEEIEEAEAEEAGELETVLSGMSEGTRRDMLELMFETLHAGLEGVYVEEVDTPSGAAADQAKSYTELIEPLGLELQEALRHARSGARHALYGDGSVRALDDTLLDIFRRSCRLLFRAVVAGAVESEAPSNRARILVTCHRGSRLHEQVCALLSGHPDWQVFTICEGFRQLPLMTRLYGPTHLVTEVTWSGALWDQLRLLQRMPEAQAMTVFGIVDPTRSAGAAPVEADRQAGLAERGMATVLESVFEVEARLDAPLTHEAAAVPVSEEASVAGLNEFANV
jgi:CheY-like chemotaxis protein